MLARMLGAALLKVPTFEEVENDNTATIQAMAVVIIVSIAGAVGGVVGSGVAGLIFGLVAGLIQWVVWAGVTFLVGTTILKTQGTRADWGQLARTTGFAQSPGVLKILSFIPGIGQIIVVIASIWQLVAMVIAVRQALDYQSTWRAIGVVAIGFVIIVVPLAILFGLILGPAEIATSG